MADDQLLAQKGDQTGKHGSVSYQRCVPELLFQVVNNSSLHL